MTDSQRLLAEYVRNGSEPAFRELVARYLNLVCSTALRIVGGDAHLAEDVAQTVFVDLARLARTLSQDVMVGGWLHRHTCFVAAKAVRSDRRRQLREREAVEMNASPDHSPANLAQISPVLDEAIDQLSAEDRQAILLRFFEQCDLRSVGEALGSTEDAARMRVNRALDKLHVLLKGRGVALSAAALGTALATGVVSAAPAGLAITISSGALTNAAAGTGATLTLLKLMSMTKLQTAILGAVIVAGVAAPLVIHNRTQIKALTDGSASLRQRVDQLTGLASALEQENHRLSNLVAQANSPQLLANADLDELLRLRGEVGVLRQQAAKVQSAATTSELVLKAIAEDQTGLRAQFPDAFGAEMRYSAATNAGTATPVAALQTWLWTQRTGDADGLLNLWDFPPGTTEEQKLAAVREVQKTNADHRRNVEYAMQHPGLGGEGNFETFKLWGLYPLGNDYYLGVINEQDPHLISAAQTVVYHLVGNEWKVYRPAPRDVPPL